jgi:hypothetical protein
MWEGNQVAKGGEEGLMPRFDDNKIGNVIHIMLTATTAAHTLQNDKAKLML